MAIAAVKPKPAVALAKPAAKPVVAKPATAAKPAKAAKEAKPAKPPKPVEPFVNGEIAVFKGYSAAEKPKDAMFTDGEEVAVVGSSEREGTIVIAVVKVADYHKYVEDPNSVNGEEILASEVKRTKKTVPAPFHLPMVGEMGAIMKANDGDPQAIAHHLYATAEKNFFYLGGVLAKLYKEKDAETGASLFTAYQNSEGKNYEDSKEGFEAFLKDTLGGEFGGSRKSFYLMSIYESVSALPNAAEVVKKIGGVGWEKAALLAKYFSDTNALELIGVAEESKNYDTLKETLTTKYTAEGAARGVVARNTIKRTTITFKVYEDAGEGIELILKAAAKQLGIQDPNALFEHIVNEWAADHLAEAKAKAAAAVAKKQKALKAAGVKLPADHPAAPPATPAA